MDTKTCTCCGVSKSIDEFGIHNRKAEGRWKGSYLKSECKNCIKEKHHQDYEKKAEALNKPVICACGSLVSRQNVRRHLGTKKHKQWIENFKK